MVVLKCDHSLSQTAKLNTCVRLRSSLEGVHYGTVYFPEFSSLDSLLLRNTEGDNPVVSMMYRTWFSTPSLESRAQYDASV